MKNKQKQNTHPRLDFDRNNFRDNTFDNFSAYSATESMEIREIIKANFVFIFKEVSNKGLTVMIRFKS